MLIQEAMSVFWRTLRDTWEELYSLAIANLVWLFSWALPLTLVSVIGANVGGLIFIVIGVCLFAVATPGMYVVANRVARGRTFQFSDFTDGVRTFWWRGLIWLLVNIAVFILVRANVVFYPSMFEGSWVLVMVFLWLGMLVFWCMMQVYFWPLLIEQEHHRMLLSWRNSAYMILANPFYAFFIGSFTVVLLGISVALVLPLVFVGMALLSILGTNAVLTLLERFGVIEEYRPKPTA
jgi:hypothetical protein